MKKINENKVKPVCGLCGKSGKLRKTECCNQWICDDQEDYVMFSYADNSCYRNHDRYTLCALHYYDGHEGDWKDCKKCRENISETEMYVWLGTNDYNFEKLPNPPSFKPTRCSKCKKIIKLGEESVGYIKGKPVCENCFD
jgi:hypothetical protein